nr:RIO1 family regulatory kinase/ATPase [Candidatus Sigynarchaeota archaeon]
SFRDVRRKRDYVEGKYHVSWLYVSRLSATREAKHLKVARDAGVSVPCLVGHNRHALVMTQYEGQEIHEFPPARIVDPPAVFSAIMKNISLTYRGAGLVHGDLGEHNIMYTTTGDVVLIDWPQAVPVTHPNAAGFLRRDVENVCSFFKKVGIYADVDDMISRIKDGSMGS